MLELELRFPDEVVLHEHRESERCRLLPGHLGSGNFIADGLQPPCAAEGGPVVAPVLPVERDAGVDLIGMQVIASLEDFKTVRIFRGPAEREMRLPK